MECFVHELNAQSYNKKDITPMHTMNVKGLQVSCLSPTKAKSKRNITCHNVTWRNVSLAVIKWIMLLHTLIILLLLSLLPSARLFVP